MDRLLMFMKRNCPQGFFFLPLPWGYIHVDDVRFVRLVGPLVRFQIFKQ